MKLVTKLSLLTCYYIRKLLVHHKDELRSIVAQGAGLCADSHTNLDRVLESLYLEVTEIAAKVQQLEELTRCHRVVVAHNDSYTRQLAEVEQQIFWILGLKLVTV